MKRKLKGNLDIKFNSLNCMNILDDMSVFINGMLEAESYVLEKIFSKLKMNDMRVTYTGPYAYIDNKRTKKENASIGKLLKVKDSDGNEWYGNDIYYFLIEECFTEVEFKKSVTKSVISDLNMYHFIVLATIRGVECEGLDILKEQLTKLELSKEDLNEIPDNAMIYIEYK